MGNDVTAPTGSAALVPELGPALGRLSVRARSADGRWVRLDDLRLELATRILELGGAARAFAAADDRAAAVSALNRQAWLVEWERAVAEATERIVQAVNARLDAAAVEARLPKRRRHELPLSDPDCRAISGRLGAGGFSFLLALEGLEQLVPSASAAGARGDAAVREWQEALLGVARRLESAWLELDTAAQREEGLWGREIQQVRTWSRATWPLWVATGVLLGGVTWLGLVFGGYLPVPGWLQGVAEAVWARF
jgi:hypothetical protein